MKEVGCKVMGELGDSRDFMYGFCKDFGFDFEGSRENTKGFSWVVVVLDGIYRKTSVVVGGDGFDELVVVGIDRSG